MVQILLVRDSEFGEFENCLNRVKTVFVFKAIPIGVTYAPWSKKSRPKLPGSDLKREMFYKAYNTLFLFRDNMQTKHLTRKLSLESQAGWLHQGIYIYPIGMCPKL